MKPKQAALFFLCLVFIQLTSLEGISQTNMFRGNAEHNLNTNVVSNAVFGETAWKFNADAPVRSTVVCNNNAVFFGSSKGIFYSLNKNNGTIRWLYNTGAAIESSAALYNGNVFFSDNKQSLYSVNASTGKLNWKFNFGPNRNYDWGFDYFYSSPTISGNKILIGAKDGFMYNINVTDGKMNWKFKTDGIVRSTPAVSGNLVFFGDTDGILYAADLLKGKEAWRFFTLGYGLKNEDFGFDRRAIISSPVVSNDKVIAGCRDGLFYAVNKNTGKEIWRVDHDVSWVISSIAIKDTIAVTGTSDGRFIQAVNVNTGKEIWKYRTISIVWSSPLICNDKVYIGSQEGILYCLDLFTGKKINGFQGQGKIFSSPVISDSLLYFGTDMGYIYALKPAKYTYPAAATDIQRYVFWEPDVNMYFHYGNDIKVRDYLQYNRYKVLHAKELSEVLSKQDSAANSVIVFASNYFPPGIINGYEGSLLRQYLNNGGRVVVLGNNPITYKTENKQIQGFEFLMADSVLNIKYGPNDLRSTYGLQPAFATEEGKQWGLQSSWTAFLPLDPKQVDIVLGKDENGKASAWLKKYSKVKGSGFIQVWLDPDNIEEISTIMRLAEYGF